MKALRGAWLGILVTLLSMLKVKGQSSILFNSSLYGPCTTASPCMSRQGAIIVGGFFSVHDSNNKSTCGDVRPGGGLQRLEAARWALENLPLVPTLALNTQTTIGYDLRDTCSTETILRDHALEFINTGSSCIHRGKPVSIVLGASSSGLTSALTNILTLFDLPHISYAASSDILSMSGDTTLFYRTVPTDQYQVSSVIALMEHFNWSYVSLVYSNDDYGQAANQDFIQRQRGAGNSSFRFCLAASIAVGVHAEDSTYHDALAELTRNEDTVWHRNATIVILFMSAKSSQRFLEVVQGSGVLQSRPMTFIVSDTLSGDVYSLRNLGDKALGILSVEPYFADDDHVKMFLDDFEARTFSAFPNTIGNWYTDYFKALFPNCTNFNSPPCRNHRVRDSKLYTPDSKVASTIRAAEVALTAIHETLRQTCVAPGFCSAARDSRPTGNVVDSTLLSKILPALNITNNKTRVAYDKSTRSFLDVAHPYRYVVKNVKRANSSVMQQSGRTVDFVEVGTWSREMGLRMTQPVRLGNGEALQKSICAEQCLDGYYRRLLTTDGDCCWSCVKCAPHHFARDNTVVSCVRCPSSMAANSRQTGCVDLVQEYIGYSNAVGGFTVALTVIGLVATLVVSAVFIKNMTTPLVVASSRELSTCLLIGILFSYLLVFPFFLPPSPAACGIRRVGLGFTLSLSLSALLVKTNRISRIFNRRSGAGRPKYISPASQLVFTGCFVLVEVILLCVWLILQPPTPFLKVETANSKLLLVCKFSSSFGLSISLAYNIILLLLCTYYGVKTRKIPENFNEAKYINFSTYTICAVSFAFIPAFATVREDIKPTMLILPHILNMTCMLAFLFVPKAYIIVFHPEKNVRSTARRKSKDYGRKYQMRHTSRKRQSNNSTGSPADSDVAQPLPRSAQTADTHLHPGQGYIRSGTACSVDYSPKASTHSAGAGVVIIRTGNDSSADDGVPIKINIDSVVIGSSLHSAGSTSPVSLRHRTDSN
ncbi:metabotropic glutamate receptor 3-like isoform X2 [Sycon ciliatum]|uniref:metabotropic glutamate receptor 3-like isoform X2 n=1 Tax=Sycon ciliatum TaxID=27933 RepID=UPI0031F6B9A8|eukprot:scpid36129/ scgid2061/ Metabotropic glutamate receptor 3